MTVVGVKRQKADFADAKPDTVVNRGEGLIVAGPTKLVEALAALM